MMRSWLVGVVFVLGCQPTVRSRAEVAYATGDYVGAVALYDRALAEKPGDGDAHVGRARARNAAFRSLIAAAHAARVAGNSDAAVDQLRRFLELRRDWRIAPPPQLAEALATELAAATEYAATSVNRGLKTGPFAAEAALARHAAMLDLAELGHRRAELAATIHNAGLASCTQLTASTSTTMPYWTWLVDRTCAHWGGPRLVVPVLPHQLSRLDVTGAIDGARGDQNAQLRESIGAAFRASVWYAPSGPGAVRGSVTGTIAATLSARPVRLTAEWTESVPYTDYETSQESYQEPYDDSEWYQEQVPYTDSDGTTSYRSELKSRTVTKYRTAYRSVTNPVTKYRDESRTFEYEATHREGHYASALRVEFDGALRDLVPSIASDFGATGIDHDVTHSRAGVSPQHADLLTFAGFVAREEQRMRARVLTALGEHYRRVFCVAPTFTLDSAAACAFFDPKDVPQPVHAALRVMIGSDEPYLMRALGR